MVLRRVGQRIFFFPCPTTAGSLAIESTSARANATIIRICAPPGFSSGRAKSRRPDIRTCDPRSWIFVERVGWSTIIPFGVVPGHSRYPRTRGQIHRVRLQEYGKANRQAKSVGADGRQAAETTSSNRSGNAITPLKQGRAPRRGAASATNPSSNAPAATAASPASAPLRAAPPAGRPIAAACSRVRPT